jgi:hypothetical protein
MPDEIFPALRDEYRWLAVSHSDGRLPAADSHDGAHARTRSDPFAWRIALTRLAAVNFEIVGASATPL